MMKLHICLQSNAGLASPGRKWTSLAYSLLLHASFVAFCFLGPVPQGTTPAKIVMLTAEEKKKVIWYDFRQRLPEVSPAPVAAKKPFAKGSAPQAISAGPPQASKANQFVWVPAPKIVLEQDLRAPNVITLAPQAPAPPPKPMQFRAPQHRFTPLAARTIDAPPEIRAGGNSQFKAPVAVIVPPAAPKLFIPPPGQGGEGAAGPAALEAPPPLANSSVAGGVPGGSDKATAAIVGLRPTNLPDAPIPEGIRNGRVEIGSPNGVPGGEGGGGSGTGIIVPNLSIEGQPGLSTGAVKAAVSKNQPMSPGEGAARKIPTVIRNLPAPRTQAVSVAYWPNARTLASAIESRFRNRVVYVTVIPAPAPLNFGQDWVLWFAQERPAVIGTQPVMRPPTPVRQVVPQVEPQAMRNMQLTAILRSTGRLDSVLLLALTPDKQLLADAFVEALREWQFTPAILNGTPVDVEIFIDIPSPPQPILRRAETTPRRIPQP